ncbi:MAG: hypothetical protein AAF335_00125 [Bacteroidota bacterium]
MHTQLFDIILLFSACLMGLPLICLKASDDPTLLLPKSANFSNKSIESPENSKKRRNKKKRKKNKRSSSMGPRELNASLDNLKLKKDNHTTIENLKREENQKEWIGLNEQLDALNSQLEALMSENENLKSKNLTLDLTNKELERDYVPLIAKNNKLQEDYESLNKDYQELEDNISTNLLLQKQVIELHNQLEEAKINIRTKDLNIKQLKSKMNNIKQQLDNKEIEYDRDMQLGQDDIKKLRLKQKDEITKLENKIKILETENERWQTDYKALKNGSYCNQVKSFSDDSLYDDDQSNNEPRGNHLNKQKSIILNIQNERRFSISQSEVGNSLFSQISSQVKKRDSISTTMEQNVFGDHSVFVRSRSHSPDLYDDRDSKMLEELKKKYNELLEKNSNLSTNNTDLIDKVDELEKKYNELLEKNSNLSTNNTDLIDKVDELEKKYNAVLEENKKLLADNTALVASAKEIEEKYNAALEENNKLLVDHTSLISSAKEIEEKYTLLSENYNKLENQYNDLLEEFNKLKVKNNKLSVDKKNSIEKEKKLTEKYNILSKAHNKLKTKKDKLAKNKKGRQKETKKVERKYNTLLEEHKDLKNKNEKLLVEKRDLVKKHESLSKAHTTLEEQHGTLKEKLQEAEAKVVQLGFDNAKLTKKYQDQEKKAEEAPLSTPSSRFNDWEAPLLGFSCLVLFVSNGLLLLKYRKKCMEYINTSTSSDKSKNSIYFNGEETKRK